MNQPDFIDADTGVVGTAGRNTAATAEAWASWGVRAQDRLAAARDQVINARLRAAFEEYAHDWVPELHKIAHEVAALGGNTTAAANTVANADANAADALSGTDAAVNALGSVLNRPI